MQDAPEIRHLCDLSVELGVPIKIGDAPIGRRRIIPIIGCTVTGDRLTGTILDLGADWQTVYGDASAMLDTRYAMETGDGALIDIRNFGFRHGPKAVIDALARGEDVDAGKYYMRTSARFETGNAEYEWLNRIITVGTGKRDPKAVRISLFEVL